MKKIVKGILVTLTILIVFSAGGWLYLRSQIHQPSEQARQAATRAQTTQPVLSFKADLVKGPQIIFYPGALVAPESYSVWAEKLAAAGYQVSIVRFPLDLAVLAPQRAHQVLAKHQRAYVIGGHSLGGVMASRFAQQHQAHLKGVFFLASYPDKKGSLRQLDQPVLSVTASRDGVLDWSAYRQAKQYLPHHTSYQQIKGGNHAGFGSYGAQKGDHTATISSQAQQQRTAIILLRWLRQLK